jgi:hypothetical protein
MRSRAISLTIAPWPELPVGVAWPAGVGAPLVAFAAAVCMVRGLSSDAGTDLPTELHTWAAAGGCLAMAATAAGHVAATAHADGTVHVVRGLLARGARRKAKTVRAHVTHAPFRARHPHAQHEDGGVGRAL